MDGHDRPVPPPPSEPPTAGKSLSRGERMLLDVLGLAALHQLDRVLRADVPDQRSCLERTVLVLREVFGHHPPAPTLG